MIRLELHVAPGLLATLLEEARCSDAAGLPTRRRIDTDRNHRSCHYSDKKRPFALPRRNSTKFAVTGARPQTVEIRRRRGLECRQYR